MILLTQNEERQARRSERVDAGGTRGLLLTVLGEFVLPHGGAAWTQTLIDAMAEVGVSEKATRQLLTRLEARGWLRREKDGRRTRWHLTDASDALLSEGAQRIYRHATTVPVWNGRWSVVLASIADDDDADRHRLTVGMEWAGYGSLGQGTWISPWVDRESEAVRVVLDAGVAGPASFVAELGALGDERELAERAWDLDRLEREYRSFVTAVGSEVVGPPALGGDAVAVVVDVVHRWRRFPSLDPQLPSELLPDAWPAADAADAFGAVREAYAAEATAWWLDRETRYGRH